MANVGARRRFKPRRRVLRAVRPSRQALLWYLNTLTGFVHVMKREAKQELLRGFHFIEAKDGVMDASPWTNAINKLKKSRMFNGLKIQADNISKLAARKSLYWVDDKLKKNIKNAFGVDVRFQTKGKTAQRMRELVAWNMSLITTLPDRMLEDLADKLSTGLAMGMRHEEMAKFIDQMVEEAGDNCEANAGLIARDQTNKMNAAFNQTRQVEVGITKYIWRTSDDERVRGEHAKLDGKEFSWEEPGPLAGTIDGRPCHPGEDIQCRCDAIPVFE